MKHIKTLLRNTRLDIELGVFGPALSYHTSWFKHDNARLVISLIFIKLYLTLPWTHYSTTYEQIGIYGFYSEQDPARIIFYWGDFVWRWIMPWEWMCTKRVLIDDSNNPLYPIINDDEISDVCIQHNCLYGYEFDFYITRNTYRPNCTKKWDWFEKQMYEVNVTFKNKLNGHKRLRFVTPQNILILDQIGLYILAEEEKMF